MRNLNTKAFIWILVGVSIAVWVGLLYLFGLDPEATWNAARFLPTVVTFDVGVWLLFVKWGWKFKPFQGWLVPFPNLEGTWQGELKSTWINPETQSKLNPIPVILVIKQSFLSISAIMYSREMMSRSYAAEFLIDHDSGLKKLVYTYTSEPKVEVRGRSQVHNGTTTLGVINQPRRALRGEYWTNRETTGDIILEYQCRELLEDFPQDSA